MYPKFVIKIIQVAYELCAVQKYNVITLISTSMVYALISLLTLPVNIRLAGQLIMQVFKYRFIVREHAPDSDDNKVMTAYYQHFQVFLAIVCSILGFNVFNVAYQFYLSVSIWTNEWDRELEVGHYLGVLAQVFQEAIMLFGLTLVLQVDYYFKGENFKFYKIIIAIAIRIVYLLTLEFGISKYVTELTTEVKHIDTRIQSWYLAFITWIDIFFEPLSLIYFFDALTRVFIVFGYINMGLRRVKKYIKDFNNDIGTRFLERTRYEDKIRAAMLLKIAAWGTYSLTIFFFVDALIVGACVSFSTTLQVGLGIVNFDTKEQFQHVAYPLLLTMNIGLILSFLFSILPSLLYTLFLVILWRFFRHKFQVKHSGYTNVNVSASDLTNEREELFTNQDHLHHVFYKPKNKILLYSYGIIIVSVSIAFSLALSPLLIRKFKTQISLRPSDYYEFNETGLKSQVESCPYFAYSLTPPTTILNPSLISPQLFHCTQREHLPN